MADTMDELLDHFDMDEADYNKAKASVLVDVENFIGTILPKLDPYLRVGIDAGAKLAGGAAGPAAPVVSFITKLIADTGLSIVEAKLKPKT